MEQRRIDMLAWRERLPIVRRGRQHIRVDINCQRKRVTAPLTLVLALAQSLAFQVHCMQQFREIGLFSYVPGCWSSGQYMHFSKS